jgi:hypothetical protein
MDLMSFTWLLFGLALVPYILGFLVHIMKNGDK